MDSMFADARDASLDPENRLPPANVLSTFGAQQTTNLS
jgi:hypothetical protein